MAYYFTASKQEQIKDNWKATLDKFSVDLLLDELAAAEAAGGSSDGHLPYGVLRVAANVANGETVTIGSDVFEVDIINTDSSDDTSGGDFNNTTDPLEVELDATAYSNLSGALSVGDLIRIENEIMKVTNVRSLFVRFARGRCGTTAATHADAQSIYTSDSAPSNIPVGLVGTLTPAVFTDALVDEINSDAGTEAVSAVGFDDNTVLVAGNSPAALATATTETLAGAGNAWDAATFGGGEAPAHKQFTSGSHVPTSGEATAGEILIPLPFNGSYALVQVLTTATNAVVLWNGDAHLVDASGGAPAYLNLNNDGATDWSASTTINYIVFE